MLSDTTELRVIVNSLFEHPPVNEAELAGRLKGQSFDEVERLVVDRLASHKLQEREGPLFLAILGYVGIKNRKRDLIAIALESNRAIEERLWASMVVTSEDPESMDMLIKEIGLDGMGAFAEMSLFQLLNIQSRKDIGVSIASALEVFQEDRPMDELLKKIEDCRKGIGASCVEAYGESLKDGGLKAIHDMILEVFIEDADEEGIGFIEKLRDKVLEPAKRRKYQAALLRMRSRNIDPMREESKVAGQAFVSSCDGVGDFFILGIFELAHQTKSIARICVRAGGDVREGILYPRRASDEAQNIIDKAKQSIGAVVEMPIDEVAGIVAKCVEKTELEGLHVPREASSAISMFEKVKLADDRAFDMQHRAAKSAKVSKSAIEALLGREEYGGWFFDLGDLGGEAINSDTELKIDKDLLRERLVAMTEHMARWHYHGGDQAACDLCMEMSRQLHDDFNSSELVHVMLERSMIFLQSAQKQTGCRFGNPSERQHFKSRFFGSTRTPIGRDLACLDMTEAASTALRMSFELLPGEHRPRDEELFLAAYSLGRAFSELMIDGDEKNIIKGIGQISSSRLAQLCHVSDQDGEYVLTEVTPLLFAFVDDVCSLCPVNCLKHPEDDVSSVFFAPKHPMAEKSEETR